MEELQKLYNVLNRDGFYTKSFDEFVKQSQDLDYQKKVFGVASREGYFTKSENDFNAKYFSKTPVKKKALQVLLGRIRALWHLLQVSNR